MNEPKSIGIGDTVRASRNRIGTVRDLVDVYYPKRKATVLRARVRFPADEDGAAYEQFCDVNGLEVVRECEPDTSEEGE